MWRYGYHRRGTDSPPALRLYPNRGPPSLPDGENSVHFLNQVDEADLLALMEDGGTGAATQEIGRAAARQGHHQHNDQQAVLAALLRLLIPV